jgi:hypothetical protein
MKGIFIRTVSLFVVILALLLYFGSFDIKSIATVFCVLVIYFMVELFTHKGDYYYPERTSNSRKPKYYSDRSYDRELSDPPELTPLQIHEQEVRTRAYSKLMDARLETEGKDLFYSNYGGRSKDVKEDIPPVRVEPQDIRAKNKRS